MEGKIVGTAPILKVTRRNSDGPVVFKHNSALSNPVTFNDQDEPNGSSQQTASPDILLNKNSRATSHVQEEPVKDWSPQV